MKFLVVILLFLFSSCQFIAKRVNNIKKAKVEDASSINSWLKKNNLHSPFIATVAPEKYIDLLDYTIGINMFNSFGVFLSYGYSDGKFCPKDLDITLSELTPGQYRKDNVLNYKIRKSILIHPQTKEKIVEVDTAFLSLNDFYGSLKTLEGKNFSFDFQYYADYIVVIPFAKFFGQTIQVSDIRKYLKAISSNKRSRFAVLLINFDKQAWWGEEWNKKIQPIL